MSNTKAAYRLDKPLIIGEFSAACSARNSVSSMYKHFYEVGFETEISNCVVFDDQYQFQKDYDGAFGWQLYDEGKGHCSDGKTKTLQGCNSIKGRTDHGQISVNI